MAAGNVIASLLIKLGLDSGGVETGAKRAEEAIGGIGGATKAAIGVAGIAAAAGFGLMAKGALEGERAMGAFQAATGKSAEEAKAFAHDMNDLVGTNATVGRSFEDIAAAGTKVVQQFGLEGQAAKDLTSDFLAFAKVTGQGADVVDDFDAALDAWGEPAERASSLMDQLIAGNQKFGTDAGPAALRALTDMAPALKALGLGLDDGNAMLNLFEAAGMDASKATFALNRAVKDLKPGQTFDDLVREIAGIEDPTKRAQRAIEIFGARGGVGMANALKPGVRGLADFGISIEEAADKSETASDAMVTTTQRIQQLFDKAMAGLRGIGMEFGPLITGIASLGSLLGPALAGVWGKVGGSAVVMGAIAKAGGIGSAIYAKAAVVANRLIAIVAAGWAAVSGSRVITAARASGMAAGAAYAAGAAAAVVAGAVAVGTAMIGIFEEADIVAKQIRGEQSKAEGLDQLLNEGVTGAIFGGLADIVVPGLREQARAIAKAGDNLNEETLKAILKPAETAKKEAPAVADAVAEAVQTVAGAFEAGADGLGIEGSLEEPVKEEFKDTVAAIRQGFGSVKQALKAPEVRIIAPEVRLENMERRFRKSLAMLKKATVAGDPFAISYWERATRKAGVQLESFRTKTGKGTKALARDFKKAGIDIKGTWLKTETAMDKSAKRGRRKVKGEVRGLVGDVRGIDLAGAGRSVIQSLIDGMRSMLEKVRTVAGNVAGTIARFFEGHSPPITGPLSHIDRDGANLVKTLLGGVDSQKGAAARAGEGIAGAFQPRIADMALAGAAGGGRGDGGGVTIQITGPVYGGPAGLRQLAWEIEQAIRPTRGRQR